MNRGSLTETDMRQSALTNTAAAFPLKSSCSENVTLRNSEAQR